MSERERGTGTTLAEKEMPEITLEPQEKAGLLDAMRTVEAPETADHLNMRVLRAVTSGEDFAPWWRQAAQRLRWMALPVLVGFGIGIYAIHTIVPPSVPVTTWSVDTSATDPPLPPLPAKIMPLEKPAIGSQRRMMLPGTRETGMQKATKMPVSAPLPKNPKVSGSVESHSATGELP